MGWGNPAVSWSELERILAGKPVRPRSGASGAAPEVDGPGTLHPADVGTVGVREGARRGRSRDEQHPGDGGDSPAWSRTRAPYRPPADAGAAPATVPFAELHTHSTYSFLDGASQPEELVEEAHRLGLEAIALTDHDGMYGVVRFAEAAHELGMRTVFGAELSLGLSAPQNGVADPEGEHLLVLARDPAGYRAISRAITEAAMDPRAEKGRPVHDLERTAAILKDRVVVLTGCRKGHVRRALDGNSTQHADRGPEAAARALDRLVGMFGADSVAVELTDHGLPVDVERNDLLAELAARAGLPTVASTAAHYATPDRARIAAALGAVRARRSLDEAEGWLPPGTAHLRSGAEMAARFARHPEAVTHAAVLGRECAFELSLLAPELPPFAVPAGETEASWLRHLVDHGARERYGSRADHPRAWEVIDHEMAIIEGQNFPGYFLIVADIVRFCREADIYCQGRGSAANSAVCFALGITHVDAVAMDLLFERFLSPERDGYPDIDLDIESDRREEAIQYVYDRYGRDRAAQVANVITYRPRSAVRDAARALGFAQGQQDAWSKLIDRWGPGADLGDQVPGMPRPVASLAEEIAGFPRHLGIHSGGMVICDRPVDQVVPVEWARMAKRSVIQWDKDDAAAVGLVKFDLLGLGMLSVLHYASDYVAAHHGRRIELHELQPIDPAVFAMLARGDSVGVFQVESRAQMATLPRLKPREFYDLVVEVALIRPGPIQGGSVHPYIRRRNKQEQVVYDHPLCEPALRKTLGVPLFQEQLMQLATDVAGFSAAEADELRRALSAKRSEERLERLRARFYAGMAANQITGDVADRIFAKTRAFANFGFPESHSISFASLVYVSAWYKHYFPAAFCAALLRAQPMGFYSPQSLVADARRHGVVVLGPDVTCSRAEPELEPHPESEGGVAVRLGLGAVRGLGDEVAERIVEARETAGPFAGAADLARRADLTTAHLEALATGGALGCFGLGRREALWAAGAAAAGTAAVRAGERHDRLPDTAVGLDAPALPGMSAVELTIADVWATGVTPDGHPVTHLRAALEERGALSVAGVAAVGEGERIEVGGVVTHRQRPATAGGTTFLNLEDETGMLNVVCSEGLWARHRVVARTSAALVIRGRVERAPDAPTVVNLVADRMERLDLVVPSRSRDFR
ncbi:error-prone DNA polymerase [Actinomycetospora sp. TBRC 11914]|uniref:error-prone DNA polymerase n=1 Tax=Actinomycetospora sp. TBRC 11914 TaxID=2729387 RepID=UPI00145F72C5|nr:error-prone DNA polymerase [Actinomycetospora sp. TBRC 11914]NMO93842.1 error-prone DNA polymerase [Actinomycetospora sp. TBRC 11914]